jgi:transposase
MAAHQARFNRYLTDRRIADVSGSRVWCFDGAPPYDPRTMVKLLLWGYSCGVTSSREMERRCPSDVALRYLSANQAPGYRWIARFRRRHLPALEKLFV